MRQSSPRRAIGAGFVFRIDKFFALAYRKAGHVGDVVRKGTPMRYVLFCVPVAALIAVGYSTRYTPSYADYLDQRVDMQVELIEILRTIQDEPSARAARPRLQAWGQAVWEIDSGMSSMPQPSIEARHQMMRAYWDRLGVLEAEQAYYQELRRIAPYPEWTRHLTLMVDWAVFRSADAE
jgi:hypothetical protein